jgi:hypothetical protein
LDDDEMEMAQCFRNLLGWRCVVEVAHWLFSFCFVSEERGGGVELLASIG